MKIMDNCDNKKEEIQKAVNIVSTIDIDTCMKQNCTRRRAARGLCRDHYQELAKRVKRGMNTWAAFEKWGWCTEPYEINVRTYRTKSLLKELLS